METDKNKKSVYSTPVFTEIGKMVKLTQGGPGTGTEANSHFDNNPNN